MGKVTPRQAEGPNLPSRAKSVCQKGFDVQPLHMARRVTGAVEGDPEERRGHVASASRLQCLLPSQQLIQQPGHAQWHPFGAKWAVGGVLPALRLHILQFCAVGCDAACALNCLALGARCAQQQPWLLASSSCMR